MLKYLDLFCAQKIFIVSPIYVKIYTCDPENLLGRLLESNKLEGKIPATLGLVQSLEVV